ncbi:MAG TPA: hypothetical protein PKY95_08820, partial [candidate division Zixibacteria bacterium]|nr:hypothetical protein [candidate division Zixibacteria bacterium]
MHPAPNTRPPAGRRLRFGRKVSALVLVLAVLAAAGAAALLAGCFTNPATGKETFSLYSTGQEIQIGRESDQAIRAQLGVAGDSALQRYVAGIGRNLAAV